MTPGREDWKEINGENSNYTLEMTVVVYKSILSIVYINRLYRLYI